MVTNRRLQRFNLPQKEATPMLNMVLAHSITTDIIIRKRFCALKKLLTKEMLARRLD